MFGLPPAALSVYHKTKFNLPKSEKEVCRLTDREKIRLTQTSSKAG